MGYLQFHNSVMEKVRGDSFFFFHSLYYLHLQSFVIKDCRVGCFSFFRSARYLQLHSSVIGDCSVDCLSFFRSVCYLQVHSVVTEDCHADWDIFYMVTVIGFSSLARTRVIKVTFVSVLIQISDIVALFVMPPSRILIWGISLIIIIGSSFLTKLWKMAVTSISVLIIIGESFFFQCKPLLRYNLCTRPTLL